MSKNNQLQRESMQKMLMRVIQHQWATEFQKNKTKVTVGNIGLTSALG